MVVVEDEKHRGSKNSLKVSAFISIRTGIPRMILMKPEAILSLNSGVGVKIVGDYVFNHAKNFL